LKQVAVEEAVVGDVGGEDAVGAVHRAGEGGDVGFVHFAVAVEVGGIYRMLIPVGCDVSSVGSASVDETTR